jgi:hypothetical protein
MNEQMKAVGRQARLVFIEDGVYGQRWYSSKCGLDASEYENLVKLIVKECANVVNDNYSHGSSVVYKILFEHFGVEE